MTDQLVTDAEIDERIEAERAWAGRPDYRRTLDMRALLDLKVARAREAEYRDALAVLHLTNHCLHGRLLALGWLRRN